MKSKNIVKKTRIKTSEMVKTTGTSGVMKQKEVHDRLPIPPSTTPSKTECK